MLRRFRNRDKPVQKPPESSSSFSALDAAKFALQATANVADGAVHVPGLKAAAQLAIQIIDVAKVCCYDDSSGCGESMLAVQPTDCSSTMIES